MSRVEGKPDTDHGKPDTDLPIHLLKHGPVKMDGRTSNMGGTPVCGEGGHKFYGTTNSLEVTCQKCRRVAQMDAAGSESPGDPWDDDEYGAPV